MSAGVTQPAAGTPLIPLRSPTGTALIAATVFASGVASYDAYVVNVVVPAISRRFDASVSAVQWTLTSYLLAVAALLLIAGALADRFGRRRMLTIGLLVMAVASILCASASSTGTLIAARAVQGIGAAFVVPTALALVALRRVPENGGERGSLSLDALGALLAVVGLGGVVYGLTDGAQVGWGSPRILIALVGGVACLVALVPAERRRRAPMLRLSLFASRQFDAINVVTLLFYGALSAAGYLIVVELQLRLGYTAAQAGAALIPVTVVFLVLAPLSGSLVARIGPRWPMVAGILLVAISQVWLAELEPDSGYLSTILPAGLVRGLGLGLAVTPLTAAVLDAVGDADLGEASAINDAASRVGGVIAVALVPLLIGVTAGATLADSLASGYEPAMIVIGGMCAAGALISLIFVSGEPSAAPRIAAPDRGCALPVPGHKEAT